MPEKVYSIREGKEEWFVTRRVGDVAVQFTVSKELAGDLDELEQYLAQNDSVLRGPHL